MVDAHDAWHSLDAAAARSLDLAHEALLAGDLPVGCAVRDGAGIIAEGRNHAYDEATGIDRLERTPIAHAEMNALARIDTDRTAADLTLWSTQQPCPMCQAAIDWVGIPSVRVIATDPSDPNRQADEALEDMWVILATAMFLVGPIRRGGIDHPMVQASATHEPEAVRLALATATDAAHPLSDGRPLTAALDALWSELTHAAAQRHSRRPS